MSNPAQEEADRFFNYKPNATSHPEDAADQDESDADYNENPPRRGIKSSKKSEAEDPDTDDEDTARDMQNLTGTKPSYTVPSAAQYSNTGPKGVIADAQNYHRAKKTGSRNKATEAQISPLNVQDQAMQKPTHGNTPSDSDIDLEDDDDDFMREWRQKRLAEMQEQYTGDAQRNGPHQRRTWGSLEQVNANGYLDVIEHTPKETNVVLLVFDPMNPDSLEVEDELKMLAYKWSKVRFVKLHHKIAEMQTIGIPAILVYRGGNIFATISGATAEGLENVLTTQGVLVG